MAISPAFLPATIRSQTAHNMSETVTKVELCDFCNNPPEVCPCAHAFVAAADECAATQRLLLAASVPASAPQPSILNLKAPAYQTQHPHSPSLQSQFPPAQPQPQPPPSPASSSQYSEYEHSASPDDKVYNPSLVNSWRLSGYQLLARQKSEFASYHGADLRNVLDHPSIQQLLEQPVDNGLSLPNYPSLLVDPHANQADLELPLVKDTRGKPSGGIKCRMCLKALLNDDSLKRHMAQMHNPQIYRHPCKYCSYTSIKKADVERHMATHTKAKDFACRICQKAFNHRGNRDRHEKKCKN